MVITKAIVEMTNWNIPLMPRAKLGYSGENAVCDFIVKTIPKENYIYYLELLPAEGEADTILLTADTVNECIKVNLTSEMLGASGIKKAQIVAYIGTEEEPIKKSNIFELEVDNSINATKSVESHYQTALSQWAQILASFNPVEILNELAKMEEQLDNKQNKLTAGYGITFDVPTAEIGVDTEEIATKDYVISKQPTDTAKGNAITLTDSTDEPIKAISIMGKSTQNGTPSIDNPIPIVDITSEEIEVTDGTETQTANLDIVLRGIPVSSGGNYTDNNNQQWLCDTIERYADGTGKFIQRVASLSGSFIGTNASNFYGSNATYNNIIGFRVNNANLVNWEIRNTFKCTEFDFTWVTAGDRIGIQVGGSESGTYFELVIGFGLSDTRFANWEDRVDWVQNLDDTFRFDYCLRTPIETPLTAEQLEQLDLSTYYPTTNINSNADVVVEYVADIQNYIDKKTSALQNAILSLGGNV